MLKNIERQEGTVTFKAPLVVAPPTYNIVNELKEEGDWAVLQRYQVLSLMTMIQERAAVQNIKTLCILSDLGCNLCMGNQEKAEKGDTVMATSTRLFQGRVVADPTKER